MNIKHKKIADTEQNQAYAKKDEVSKSENIYNYRDKKTLKH